MSLDLWNAVKAIPIMTIAEELNLQIVKDSGAYAMAVCIFHADHVGAGGKPNMSLLKAKNTFKCFACGASGTALDLYAKAAGIDAQAAVHALAEKFHLGGAPKPAPAAPASPQEPAGAAAGLPGPGKPPEAKEPPKADAWDAARVQKAHDFLMDPKNDGHLQHLLKLRSLSKEFVAKKKIGLEMFPGDKAIGLAYVIPAFDVDGKLLTVRTHSRINRKDKRFIAGMKSKFLYDLADFDPNAPEVHIGEGEGVVWRLQMMGKNAISSFAGASTIPAVVINDVARLGDLLKKTRVVFYADNDRPGEECMAKIRQAIDKSVKCFKVYWPADYPKGKDVDDWYAMGRSEAELNLLIKPYPWEEASSFLNALEEKKKAVLISRNVYEHSNCYFKTNKGKKADETCECSHKKSDHAQIGAAHGGGFVYGKCSRKKKGDLTLPCECTAFEIPHADEAPDEDELTAFSTRISTFAIHGRALLRVDREAFMRADVVTWDGKLEKDVILPPEAWRSRQQLISRLPDPEYEFTGTDNDVAQMAGLAMKTVPDSERKKGIPYIGFVDDCFVGPGFAIDKNGIVQAPLVEYIPQNLSFDKTVKIHPHNNPKQVLADFCKVYLKVNRATVTLPTLGWMTACFFKEKIRGHLNYFPIMSFFGTSGAGKTQFATSMMRLFGMKRSTQPFNANQTAFVKDRTLSSTNAVPVMVDEFKEDIGRSAIEDWKHRIRSAFGGEVTARGRQDLSVREFPFRAPLLMIGEMSVVREQAIAERTISVEPKRSNIGAAEAEAFKELNQVPLECLLPTIVQWVLSLGSAKYHDLWSAAQKELIEMKLPFLPDRVWKNMIVIAFGIHAFEAFAADHGVEFKVPAKARKEMIGGLTERILEVAQRTKMGFDYLVESLSVMAKNEIIKKGRDYEANGEWLYLHMASCVPAFRKWARETNYTSEMLDTKEYRNQAAEIERMTEGRYVYDTSKVKKFGDHTMRTIQVNLKIAARFGLDVSGFGFSEEQVPGYEQDPPASGGPEEKLPAELTEEAPLAAPLEAQPEAQPESQQALFNDPAPELPAADQEDDIFG